MPRVMIGYHCWLVVDHGCLMVVLGHLKVVFGRLIRTFLRHSLQTKAAFVVVVVVAAVDHRYTGDTCRR